MLYCSI